MAVSKSVFRKGPDSKYLGFASLTVSVKTTQLCLAMQKQPQAILAYAPIKLYSQKHVASQIWPAGCSLLVPDTQSLVGLV